MKKNRLIGLALTALLAASAVAAVPVSAYDHMDTEEMVTTYTDELPDKLKYADVAEISLAEYIEQNPVVLSEGEDEIALEDLLVQVYSESNANDLLETLASTGTWEEQSNGSWKFLLSDGTYAVGWHEINGAWYYFGTSDRLMYTGWHKIGGYYYYFNPSGSMKHGWLSSVDDDGNTIYYYMGRPGEPDTGAMYTGGWLHDTDGLWYYLYTDSDAAAHGSNASDEDDWGWEPGVMHTGWLDLDGYLYYLYPSAGHMATGNVQMSSYVLSRFETTGVHLGDTMTVKDTVTNPNTGVVYQPLNVRWDNLIVEDGHRIASATINGSLIDNALSSSPVASAVNYFSSAASQWFTLTSTSQSTANIILEWFGPDDWPYYLPWYDASAATTYCQNNNGEWTNGEMAPPYTEEEEFSTGTIVQAYIYVNEAILDNSSSFSEVNLDYLMRHEIGHAFGLRHTFEINYGESEPGIEALMHPAYDSYYAKTTLQDYDIVELLKTYP